MNDKTSMTSVSYIEFDHVHIYDLCASNCILIIITTPYFYFYESSNARIIGCHVPCALLSVTVRPIYPFIK
jgi:hypothetical protein